MYLKIELTCIFCDLFGKDLLKVTSHFCENISTQATNTIQHLGLPPLQLITRYVYEVKIHSTQAVREFFVVTATLPSLLLVNADSSYSITEPILLKFM